MKRVSNTVFDDEMAALSSESHPLSHLNLTPAALSQKQKGGTRVGWAVFEPWTTRAPSNDYILRVPDTNQYIVLHKESN